MHTFIFLDPTEYAIYVIKAFDLKEAQMALNLNDATALFLGVITQEQAYSKLKLPQELLSGTEVMDLLSIDRSKLYQMMQEGVLKSYRRNNKIYFMYSEVLTSIRRTSLKS